MNVNFKKCGSDRGKEFTSKAFQDNLNRRRIKHVLMRHAVHAERFQRSLQTMMNRYMSSKQTYRYVDVLEELVRSYNNRHHRIIKMTPNEAKEKKNRKKLLTALSKYYNIAESKKRKPKFEIDDLVRVEKKKQLFDRGYEETFSREVFKIISINRRLPIPMYKLSNLQNTKTLFGSFYANQLQLVTNPEQVYKITEIIKTRKRKGKTEHLVRWFGYGPEDDSWIQAEDIVERY